jgi:hypothetical protein
VKGKKAPEDFLGLSIGQSGTSLGGPIPARREGHLDATTFRCALGMDSAAFAALPKWKQTAKKKEAGLF